MMNVIFAAHPARRTPYGYQVAFHFGGKPEALPRKVVQAKNLKDVLAQFEAYRAEAEATGAPLKVDFMQHPRCPARKFPGFDKASRVKYFTTAADTAGETDI